MQVYEPRHGTGMFHLVAARDGGKVLCRLNTQVPNAVGRKDLGGFTLGVTGNMNEPEHFRPTVRNNSDALGHPRLCKRCRKSASIRQLNNEGLWEERSSG